jgi:hypothetical protein
MKVINLIEDQDVIKKILKPLGLWEVTPSSPKTTGPTKIFEYNIDYSVLSAEGENEWPFPLSFEGKILT